MCILPRVLAASREGTTLLAPCVISKFCILSSQFTGRCMKHAASNSKPPAESYYTISCAVLTYINVATLNIRILVARVEVIGEVIGIHKAFKPECDI